MTKSNNIFYILIISFLFIHVTYADNDECEVNKNSMHKKIDIHTIDPSHLTIEDWSEIQNHIDLSYVFDYEHEYKLKKDEYCSIDTKYPTQQINGHIMSNNKEKLNHEKKNRIKKFQPLHKYRTSNFENFEFTPFHFQTPISSK